MSKHPASLEPLADYLEPQFGNIYGYNFIVVDGIDVQPWTAELRQAIKRYLLDEASEDLVDYAFGRGEDVSQDEWVEGIIKDYQPWEVANLFRKAVVMSLPSLGALIGDLQTWPDEDKRWDAACWLEEHATEAQLRQMIVTSGHGELLQRHYVGNLDFELPRIVDPPALLAAWNDVAESALSDLTDAEWKLIKPLIPTAVQRAGNRARLDRARSAVNGMLYKFANEVPCIPRRYGAWETLYQRHYVYKGKGTFSKLLQGLRDKPEAQRLVEWLRNT